MAQPPEEAGFVTGQNMAAVTISQSDKARTTVTATTACRPNWPAKKPCSSGIAHIILAVTDSGSPSLTSYRRIILKVNDTRNNAAKIIIEAQVGVPITLDASPKVAQKSHSVTIVISTIS